MVGGEPHPNISALSERGLQANAKSRPSDGGMYGKQRNRAKEHVDGQHVEQTPLLEAETSGRQGSWSLAVINGGGIQKCGEIRPNRFGGEPLQLTRIIPSC